MSGQNVLVKLKPGESQDSLYKRYKQAMSKSGVLNLVKNRRWFVSRSEQRRLDKKRAIRRAKRLEEEKRASL